MSRKNEPHHHKFSPIYSKRSFITRAVLNPPQIPISANLIQGGWMTPCQLVWQVNMFDG